MGLIQSDEKVSNPAYSDQAIPPRSERRDRSSKGQRGTHREPVILRFDASKLNQPAKADEVNRTNKMTGVFTGDSVVLGKTY